MRHFNFQLKGFDDKGSFTGYASTFGNKDRSGDIVMPGAFDRWMKASGTGEVPILAYHKVEKPAGLGTTKIDAKGLLINGQLEFELPAANEVYAGMKSRIIKTLSIGYIENTQKTKYNGDLKAYEIHEAEVIEVSLVTVPANPEAVISTVKSFDDRDLARLAELLLKLKVHSRAASSKPEDTIARAISAGLLQE